MSGDSADDENLAHFMAFTGSSRDAAQHYLEMSSQNREHAVQLYFEMEMAMPNTDSVQEERPRHFLGEEDDIMTAPSPACVAAANAATSNATVNSYSIPPDIPDELLQDAVGGPNDPENVRAPLPAFEDRLLDGPTARQTDYYRSVQEHQANPMAQYGESTGGGDSLGKIFSPPTALTFTEDLPQAQQQGVVEEKWVLVNIQNTELFASHALNRDVWNDETVRDIIRSSFIFWQRNDTSPQGMHYINRYHPENLPHIAVIDPRTGARAKTWDVKKFKSYIEAADHLTAFLDQNSLQSKRSHISSDSSKPTAESKCSYEAAIYSKVSCDGVATSSSSGSPPAAVSSSSGQQLAEAIVVSEEYLGPVPDEPREDELDCVNTRLRFEGKTVNRRFRRSDTLQTVLAACAAHAKLTVRSVDAAIMSKNSIRAMMRDKSNLNVDEADIGGYLLIIRRID